MNCRGADIKAPKTALIDEETENKGYRKIRERSKNIKEKKGKTGAPHPKG